VGYLYPEANAEGKMDRKLLVQAAPGFIAKDRTDKLGTVITNPNIQTMQDQIFGPAQITEVV